MNMKIKLYQEIKIRTFKKLNEKEECLHNDALHAAELRTHWQYHQQFTHNSNLSMNLIESTINMLIAGKLMWIQDGKHLDDPP